MNRSRWGTSSSLVFARWQILLVIARDIERYFHIWRNIPLLFKNHRLNMLTVFTFFCPLFGCSTCTKIFAPLFSISSIALEMAMSLYWGHLKWWNGGYSSSDIFVFLNVFSYKWSLLPGRKRTHNIACWQTYTYGQYKLFFLIWLNFDWKTLNGKSKVVIERIVR